MSLPLEPFRELSRVCLRKYSVSVCVLGIKPGSSARETSAPWHIAARARGAESDGAAHQPHLQILAEQVWDSGLAV